MPFDLDLPPLPAPPRKAMGRPALGNPSIERAMNGLDKVYPHDTAGIEAVPDWSPSMFTNTMGHVMDNDPSTIHINGLSAALSKQPDIDFVAAHELEHTRQLKDPNERHVMDLARRFMPYEQRPHEKLADLAGEQYLTKRSPTPYDARSTASAADGVYNDLRQSKSVDELINLMNGNLKK